MTKRIVILGAGESGVGAALLALSKGYEVFISDSGKIKEKFLNEIKTASIPYEEGTHSLDLILNAKEIIKSPGIPEKSPVMKEIRAKGIPVVSEIEFAYRYSSGKHICITGSNGKTTTTLLLYHILKTAGLKVAVGGNVGHSYARLVNEDNYDYYVLELSSFQLDDMHSFKADIAILLNITPDHLDRYEYKLELYADSKFRITQNQGPSDALIYCLDDDLTRLGVENRKPQAALYPFSIKEKVEEGGYVENEELTIKINQQVFTMSIQELALQGKHNQYNSLAAGIASYLLKIRKEAIRECLTDFQAVEHRLEKVLKIHGVDFINDSKATNVNSTWYALESVRKPIIWIVGGVDKGNDYSQLSALVKEKVKGIVCLGTDNAKIVEAFADYGIPVAETGSMKDAVRSAYYQAKDGDTVLLSPCCASFDLFESYEDRGKQFKRAVRDL